MIRGIHHIAIHTANFDKMMRFYSEAFGFEPSGPEQRWKDSPMIDSIIGVKGSAARVCMLKAGTCFLEMFEYFVPESRDAPPLRPHDRGYTHFCVDVTDIGAEYKRLQALGMRFVNPSPVDVGDIKTVYGMDFDGNLIEIQEVAPKNPVALEQLNRSTLV
jgi:catechol 2,3-dioxygenase-like lactoylglutathione lyase family enzyme